MLPTPLIEETAALRLGAIPTPALAPDEIEAIGTEAAARRLAVYPASAGYDLVDELAVLANRAIEPNVFFDPRFLAPAMPRIEDREVRLAVIRDADAERRRLRLLVPFTLDRAAPVFGVSVMRSWSSPYSPLGTPLVDRDAPADYLEDLFALLSRPHLRLPQVFVFPDILLDGTFAGTLKLMAQSANLPVATLERGERVFLGGGGDADAYLKERLSAHHRGEFRRQWRRLGEIGEVSHTVARSRDEVRLAAETFLALESSGWKADAGTAMAMDRYHAAFFREAMDRMAGADMVRIHTLFAGSEAVASLVVLIQGGVAHAWKIAFDERRAALSPGMLLMIEATRRLLDDPNVLQTDSCAGADHPMIARLWGERRPIGTILVGLTPKAERATARAARQMKRHAEWRARAKRMRDRVKRMMPGR